MTCPVCSGSMTSETLQDHLDRPVLIDVCFACQAFWFDERESLRLSPGSTLALFRLIGERIARPRPAPAGSPACPRCGLTLARTHDQQRSTKFEYLRCPEGHGRLTTFFNFLREKNFIKPLSAQQVEELRHQLKSVDCSNCGAPVDVVLGAECTHCGSPLSMLDLEQGGALVRELREADRRDKPVDPDLPLRLEHARRESAAAFGDAPDAAWFKEVSATGLVGAGLIAVARFLAQKQ